jgi:membrane protein involved in colicin uptake
VGTGSGKASVSDAILDLFSKMHQASGAAHQGGGAGGSGSAGGSTTTASTASTMADPLSQLMAAISMDEDEPSADTESDLSMFYSSNNAPGS